MMGRMEISVLLLPHSLTLARPRDCGFDSPRSEILAHTLSSQPAAESEALAPDGTRRRIAASQLSLLTAAARTETMRRVPMSQIRYATRTPSDSQRCFRP